MYMQDCRTASKTVGQNDGDERDDKGITQQLGQKSPSIQRYNIRTAL